jgi:hypothetical protein
MNVQVSSVVRIRYNTESNGSDLCWRLLVGDKEHLVHHVNVEAPCITSKDWLEEKQVFKHHITVHNCRVEISEDLVATIRPAE